VRAITRQLCTRWLPQLPGKTLKIGMKQVQSALNTIYNKSINTMNPMKMLIECETRGMAEARFLSEVQDTFYRLELDELREDVKMYINQSQ